MARGQVVYVDRIGYRHYGIDVGDGTVIHFNGDNLDKGSARIVHTSEEEFLGSFGKMKEDLMVTYQFDEDEVVDRAFSKIGSRFCGYDVTDNNCEHFANWCACGKKTSRQIFFKNDDQDVVEKAIDIAFEPLLILGDKIDKLFGWA